MTASSGKSEFPLRKAGDHEFSAPAGLPAPAAPRRAYGKPELKRRGLLRSVTGSVPNWRPDPKW